MDDSKQEIMEATHEALKKHGYSGLSIQKIADEFDKSKSLLYHHYDGKDDILLDFMDYALEQFSECCISCSVSDSDDPEESLMEKVFIGFDFSDRGLTEALIEIRTQGIQKEEYRGRFRKFSEEYRRQLEDIIGKGKEKGQFRDVEASRVAEFVDAMNREAMFNNALGKGNEKLRAELENYLKHRVLK